MNRIFAGTVIAFGILVLIGLVLMAGCGGDDERDTSTDTTPSQTIKIDRTSGSPKATVADTQMADEICSGWQENWPYPGDDAIFFVGPNGDTLVTCAAP